MSLINDTVLDKLLRNLKALFNGKQDTLTPGSNISINNDVISATDTTYTAGANIDITNGVISATDTTYSAGSHITISNGTISTTGLVNSENPEFTGYLSLNRNANSTIGATSTALGSGCTASGAVSTAEGGGTTASGACSHSEGAGTTASGADAHSEGAGTVASGDCSHAEGANTRASGNNSHSEGGGTTASGVNAHAEGQGTRSEATATHAEGSGSYATTNFAHAEGLSTGAEGVASHAEGNSTYARSDYSHAEGNGAEVLINCQAGHAEGRMTQVQNNYAHAEGDGSHASGEASHAEGVGSYANGYASHAENNSTATGMYAHAEGAGTTNANYAHAENHGTATGTDAHAENTATASAANSHAEGYETVAASEYQHVQGKYNLPDANNVYADIVGNGSYNVPSNAYTLDWHGNGVYAGKVTVGVHPSNNMDVATKEYVDVNAGDTLPTVTSSDSGKALIVDSNGNWNASNVPISSTVSQTGVDNTNTYNNDYRILFSTTANDTTTTEGTQKNKELTFNPYSHTLKLEGEHFGDSTGGYCTSIETNEVYTDYFQTYNSQPLKKGHAGLRSSSGGGSLILTYGDATTNPTTTNNLTATPNDITLSSTWDGTNTSLKSALSALRMYDIVEITIPSLNSSSLPMTITSDVSCKFNGTNITHPGVATELYNLISASTKPTLLKVHVTNPTPLSIGQWYLTENNLCFNLSECSFDEGFTNERRIQFTKLGITSDSKLFNLSFLIRDTYNGSTISGTVCSVGCSLYTLTSAT